MTKNDQLFIGNVMPEPQTNDPTLLRVARKILEDRHNGIVLKHMVINYAPLLKFKTRAWWDRGAIAFASYEWDEFQVATAEAIADHHAIYYNEFRYYHNAHPSVRMGLWILHNRFCGKTIRQDGIKA